MSTQTYSSHKKSRTPLITVIIIIAIAVVAYLKWDWLHAQFTHATQVKFNNGEKVYVAKNRFETKAMSSIGVFRLIKSTNNKGEAILLIQTSLS